MKPASTSKQATLGKFGFTKKIETARGNCFKVQLEDFVPECEKKTDGITIYYTIYFKLNVLRDLETAAKSENTKDKYKEVAGKYQISKSMVWKWSKQEQDLKQEADKIRAKRKRIGADSSGTGRTRRRLRNYYLKKNPLAEQKLLSDFRKHRSRGLKVGGRWLKIKMRQSLRLFYGDEVADNFKGSKNWLHRFSERDFISLRRRTNKKKIGNTEKLPYYSILPSSAKKRCPIKKAT